MFRKVLPILLFVQIFGGTCYAQNIINNIAGTGVAGYSGDGGPAINCQFNRPYAINFDSWGNLYVVDAFNHVVRKISPSKIISTVAGTGVGGFSGDGGPATSAQLFITTGVAVDTLGNIYVSDGGNNRIRKISGVDGVITTVAGDGTSGYSGDGGSAVAAQIYAPYGLVIDNFGDLLIAEYYNHVIRKLNLASGIITTIAGTGVGGYTGDGGSALSAQLYGPSQISIDKDNNVIFSDHWNHAIRKVITSTGVITTIAGNGIAGYSGDGGLAVNAQLSEPSGVYVDKQSNIYIADYRNGAIRRIDAITGIISTVAGGLAGYGGDGGPATSAKLKCTDVWVDDYGHIFIADYVNHRIREVYNPATVNVQAIAGGELIVYPNPSSGIFTIETDKPGQYSLTIFNLLGQQVFQSVTSSTVTEVDLSKQAAGVYFIHVEHEVKKWVEKIILSK